MELSSLCQDQVGNNLSVAFVWVEIWFYTELWLDSWDEFPSTCFIQL